MADDIRTWFYLYSAPAALALVLFGKKSIWKTQARVLGSRLKRLRSGGSGDDLGDDLYGSNCSSDVRDPSGNKRARSGGLGERRPRVCRGDPAAEAYAKMVESESTRIGVSVGPPHCAIQDEMLTKITQGSIIASVAAAALTLDSLSQTHWIARAAWTYSLVASLMAVFCANNLSWKTGYLLLENKLKVWISGHRHEAYYYLHILSISAANDVNKEHQVNLLLDSLVPSPASTLTVSAPSMLLSTSLLFLFIGFGIFFGFTWERVLDALAGPNDSRNVFISYIAGLGFCLFIYAASDTTSHDETASTTIRGIVGRSLQRFDGDKGGKPDPPDSSPEEDILERRKQLYVIRNLLEQQKNILTHVLENQDMMELAKVEPDFKDSLGKTPLHWAAERGMEFKVLRLLRIGVNTSAKDEDGRTPLMVAAANGHVGVVRELLHAWPQGERDLEAMDEYMSTTRDLADEMGHSEIVNLIDKKLRTIRELRDHNIDTI
jgi:hypothetical protein